MTPTTTTRSFSRLAGTARGFTLVALAVPLLWEQDAAALPYLVSLASLWAVASWLQDQPLPTWCARVDLLEAALVGLVCALALPSTVGLLAALALPPFLSGLRFGFRGAAGALAAELILVVGVTAIGSSGMDSQEWGAVFTWAVTGLGLGLVAGFFSSTQGAQPDALAPYRDARQLILELLGPLRRAELGPGPGHPGPAGSGHGARRRPGGSPGRPRAAGRRPDPVDPPGRRPRGRSRCRRGARRRGLRRVEGARVRSGLRLPACGPTPVRSPWSPESCPATRSSSRSTCRGLVQGITGQLGPTVDPPRHGAALRGLPRRGHGRRAPTAGARDARRRGPGHRLAWDTWSTPSLPHPHHPSRPSSCACSGTRSPQWSPRCAARC